MQGKIFKIALACLLLTPQLAVGQNLLTYLSDCVARVFRGAAPVDRRRPDALYAMVDFDPSTMSSHYHRAWDGLGYMQAEIANSIAFRFAEGSLPARTALTVTADELATVMREARLDRIFPHRHFGEFRNFEVSSQFSVAYIPDYWLTAGRTTDISRDQALALEYRLLAEINHVEERDPQGRNPLRIADEVARSLVGGRMTFYKHSVTGQYVPTGYAFRSFRHIDKDFVFMLATPPANIDAVFDDVCIRLDALARAEKPLSPEEVEKEWAHALYGFLQSEYYAAGNHEIGMAAFAGFYRALMGVRLSYLLGPGEATEAMTRGERRFVDFLIERIRWSGENAALFRSMK